MQRSVRVLSAVALVACGACKRGESSPDAGRPDAGAVVPRSPPDAGIDAGVVASAPEVPDGAATLSLFRDVPDGGCAWVKVDPVSAKERTLAIFQNACVGARLAWPSPPEDAGSVVVWFDPVARGGSSLEGATYPLEPDDGGSGAGSLHPISLQTGEVSSLAPPPIDAGTLIEVGIADGAPSLLFLESIEERKRPVGNIVVDGVELTFDPQAEGLPALAHAYRAEASGWKKVETKATDEGSDNAQGILALDAAGALGPRSSEQLAPHAQGDVVEDKKLLKRLSPHAPKSPSGMWIFLGTSEPGGEASRFYVWEAQMEFGFTMGRVVLPAAAADGGVEAELVQAPELGFSPKDFVAVRTRGPFILIAEADSGRHPRLYDQRTGALVWKADDARGVTFWPGSYVERREHD